MVMQTKTKWVQIHSVRQCSFEGDVDANTDVKCEQSIKGTFVVRNKAHVH